MIEYKGYFGNVTFDADNNIFHGEVVGIRDVVTFQGRSVAQIRRAFRDSVDDYLAFCRCRGETPEKPLSGRFVVRIPPELHRKVSTLAARAGQSLNAWLLARLEDDVRHALPGTAVARQTGGAKSTRSRNPRKSKREPVPRKTSVTS
jgi:predicted HicB family RNase H-like nuclease